MINALAEQLMQALPEGGDPLQRVQQLARELGIRRPTRRVRRAFLRVCDRLGIEAPASAHGSVAPMLNLPPEAEYVLRAWERERREKRKDQLISAASRLQQSAIGLKVAVAAKDTIAGAKALRALAGLDVEPSEVGRDELAFAAQLSDRQLKRLFGKEAKYLPNAEGLERGFQAARGLARIILMASVKRQALDGDPDTLRYEIKGLAVSEDVARKLLGDYSPTIARRAAVKRRMLDLLEGLVRDQRFPSRAPDEPWAALAWLTIVGYLTPPIRADVVRLEGDRPVAVDRWQARRLAETEAQRFGLEVSQLQATLEVARRLVMGAGPSKASSAR